MAAKSSLKNMVICLSAICMCCSALLAATYALTLEPIKVAAQNKTNSSLAQVLPSFEGNPQEADIQYNGVSYKYYKADGAGYAIISNTSGFGGTLSLMVGITESGVVYNTVVLSHSETPGLGAKCQSDERFVSQFKQLDPAQQAITLKKDGGSLDAITASTITSRAYTLAVSNAVEVYKSIIGGNNNE